MHGHRLYDLCGIPETLEIPEINVNDLIPEGMPHHLRWSLVGCRLTLLWVTNMPPTAVTCLHPILVRVQSAAITEHDQHRLYLRLRLRDLL
jgi:hypothetical protein